MGEFPVNTTLVKRFVAWLEQPKHDQRHAKNWALLFHNDPEAAMCEATFWAVLSDCGVHVEPNCDLTGNIKSPDFRCHKNGAPFYVETTCVRIDTATRKTGLESVSPERNKAQHYGLLNKAVWSECVNKTPQCANLNAPCVLAIGTFHQQASRLRPLKMCAEWLVTGAPKITMNFDPTAGRAFGEPYQTTQYESAAFASFSKQGDVAAKRKPISALLIGGFGWEPISILGILHPISVRPFDPSLLHRIPFCKKAPSPEHVEATEWIQTAEDWHRYT